VGVLELISSVIVIILITSMHHARKMCCHLKLHASSIQAIFNWKAVLLRARQSEEAPVASLRVSKPDELVMCINAAYGTVQADKGLIIDWTEVQLLAELI